MNNSFKISVIGGGTGTFTILSGLKKYNSLNLTAIVSSADDGGSNKKFRDEFGLLPPSDFRQCLVALSSDEPSHAIFRKLMMYRFSKGVGLEGQTFGNILIAALTEIEGSQLNAFEEVGKILNIKGQIIPITTENIRLMAEYDNGSISYGEHLIDEPEDFHEESLKVKRLFLNRKAEIYEKAKDAILNSDYIILGPGDLYTSTLANFVVDGAKDAISESKAKIIYIGNLMTKFGQTYKFKVSDHIEEIKKYTGRVPDYILINNSQLNPEALKTYQETKNDVQVEDDLNDLDYVDSKIIRADLVSNQIIEKHASDKLVRSLIRHDSNKLAEIIYNIVNQK